MIKAFLNNSERYSVLPDNIEIGDYFYKVWDRITNDVEKLTVTSIEKISDMEAHKLLMQIDDNIVLYT